MHGADNQTGARQPRLSVVVIFHNMQRESERTLYSLSADYQEGVSADEYEVIAIDNASNSPLSEDRVRAFGPNFKYHYLETESVSPVGAVNMGSRIAKGENIAIIVDGARMATPGLLLAALKCLQFDAQPFVSALTWHLGPDVQHVAMTRGYDKAEEDRLLASIDWRNSGYRLFEISTIAPASRMGFLGGMPSECSWFAMRRARFLEMNGFDERFQSPGGGLVNHDFLDRVLERHDMQMYMLLGEGTFHQMHGGIATNSKPGEHPIEAFREEYQRICGKPFEPGSGILPTYFGRMPRSARRFISQEAARLVIEKNK